MKKQLQQFFKLYMVCIGVIGQLLFFAQAYKIFATKSAHDVSGFGFSIGLVSVTSWLIYGMMLKDPPLIIANVVAVIGAFFVIVGICLYG